MKILLVEDDPRINQNIKEALSGEGFFVDTAFDGMVAEKFFRKETYDCLILDINLPYMNGYELCKLFRKTNPITPVLFLTAFDELGDKVQGFESGGDDYLTKPFFMRELLLRIQSLIKRTTQPGGSQKEKILIEDIVIDQRNKKVTRAGVEISLTPREYQILLRLTEAQGELVSKQELIKEIWGRAFDANTNTIEVYINFLRNKLDKPFTKPLIKTKVGFGYYLDVSK